MCSITQIYQWVADPPNHRKIRLVDGIQGNAIYGTNENDEHYQATETMRNQYAGLPCPNNCSKHSS